MDDRAPKLAIASLCFVVGCQQAHPFPRPQAIEQCRAGHAFDDPIAAEIDVVAMYADAGRAVSSDCDLVLRRTASGDGPIWNVRSCSNRFRLTLACHGSEGKHVCSPRGWPVLLRDSDSHFPLEGELRVAASAALAVPCEASSDDGVVQIRSLRERNRDARTLSPERTPDAKTPPPHDRVYFELTRCGRSSELRVGCDDNGRGPCHSEWVSVSTAALSPGSRSEDTKAPAARTTTTPQSGGICEIDPTVCETPSETSENGPRVYAVGSYRLRWHRVEANASWAMSLSAGGGPEARVHGYVTDNLALGADAVLLSGTATPFREPGFVATADASWVATVWRPRPVTIDGFLVGGAGVVALPDRTQILPRAALDVGVGVRAFVRPWLAFTFQVRGYAMPEPAALFLASAGVSFIVPPHPYANDQGSRW